MAFHNFEASFFIDKSRTEGNEDIDDKTSVDKILEYFVFLGYFRLKGHVKRNGKTVPEGKSHNEDVPTHPEVIVVVYHAPDVHLVLHELVFHGRHVLLLNFFRLGFVLLSHGPLDDGVDGLLVLFLFQGGQQVLLELVLDVTLYSSATCVTLVVTIGSVILIRGSSFQQSFQWIEVVWTGIFAIFLDLWRGSFKFFSSCTTVTVVALSDDAFASRLISILQILLLPLKLISHV